MPFRSRSKPNPIDQRQQELAEQERALQEQIRALQQQIAEAPKKAEERLRAKKEALVRQSRERVIRWDAPAALADRRFDEFEPPRRRSSGRLRSEQRADRIKFIFLLLGMVLLLFLLILRVT